MRCFHCGMNYQDGMTNCPNCGAPTAASGGQSNIQGQPYGGGQTYGGQSNMQGQTYMQGQTNMQGQPNFGGQPYMQGQPNFGGQPYMQGQPNFGGQPYMQGQPNFGGQPYMQGQTFGNGQKLSRREFLNHPNCRKYKSGIAASAIMLYFCAGLTLIFSVFVGGNIFSLVDVALVLGLALGLHLAQSRACGVIITVYSIINVIYMTILTGQPSGYLITIGAIGAMICAFQFHKAWDDYQRTGILPSSR